MFGLCGREDADVVAQESGESDEDEIEYEEAEEFHGSGHESFCFPNCHGVSALPSSRHRLPHYIKGLRTLLTGVAMAVVSSAMVYAEVLLINKKFELAQIIMDANRTWSGVLAAVAFLCAASALMVGIAACFVVGFYPRSAGSGLPELKSFLNGNPLPGMYGYCKNWVAPVGAVLATGAGLPVDREGPLISIGGAVGVAVTSLLTRGYFKKWVSSDRERGDQELLMMDEEAFSHMKQNGAILGAAAGLAVAYNAPVGGVLYMLEEVTLSAWPEKLTATAGVTVIIAVLIARLVIENVYGQSVHSLVIFSHGTNIYQLPWNWIDVPLILVVAILVAIVSAVHSAGLWQVWRLRHGGMDVRKDGLPRRRYLRVIDAVLYAILCAAVLTILPQLFGSCLELPSDELIHDRVFIQYTCEAGQYNQLATLFMQGEEGAVKTLFARDTLSGEVYPITNSSGNGSSSSSSRRLGGSSSGSSGGGGHGGELIEEYDAHILIICLIFYLPLSIFTAGLPLPMGYFVPSMFLGALVGRATRAVVGLMGIGGDLAHPGVYALLGSAGALSSFTHMSLAIVVLLAEVTKDINLVAPLMIVVLTSRWFNKELILHPYDEQLMIEKCVPYLEVECPHHLDNECITAGSLCAKLPEEAVLRKRTPLVTIQQLLSDHGHLHWFPVVNDECSRCIGIVHYSRLQSVIEQIAPEEIEKRWSSSSNGSEDETEAVDRELGVRYEGASSGTGTVEVMQFADPAPHCVLADMPIVRLYAFFSRAGVSAVCVLANIDGSGVTSGAGIGPVGVVGVLSKRDLVAAEHAPIDMDPSEHQGPRRRRGRSETIEQ